MAMDSASIVVKRTFIEIQDEEAPFAMHMRSRAFSDFAEYGVRARCGSELPMAEDEGCVGAGIDFGPKGGIDLSDAESQETNPDMSVPHEPYAQKHGLPCYSHLTSERDLPLTASGSSDTETRAPEPSEYGSEGSGANAEVRVLSDLLAKNARLAQENELLRENMRLAAENAALKAGTNPGQKQEDTVQAEVQPRSLMQSPMNQPMQPPMQMATYAIPVQGMQAYAPEVYAPQPQAAFFVPGGMEQWGAGTGGSRRARKQRAAARDAAEMAWMAGGFVAQPCAETRTTVMLRNLPNNYTRRMVLAMLDSNGFQAKYDFFYLPIDFKTGACLGYAFVNLVSPCLVDAFWRTFDGFSRWVLPSKKICGVTWSGPHQGLKAHVERYRNSPVMHASVPEDRRPLIFESGTVVPFPAPTKEPRPPRARNCAEGRM